MARGIEQRCIFADEYDRRGFLMLLERVLTDTGTRCLAWALMDNHYHLLLQTGDSPLSRVLHRVNLMHAQRFNRRHRRVGHLFQGRFHSKLVTDDDYLAGLVGYVHLNPVKAGLVANVDALAHHRWTGHRALLGLEPCAFLDVDGTLSLFGATRDVALEGMGFMLDGIVASWHEDCGDRQRNPAAGRLLISWRQQCRLKVHGLDGVLAPRNWTARPLQERDARLADRARLRLAGWSLDRVLSAVCASLDVAERQVREGRRIRRICAARAVAAYLASTYLGNTDAELARTLGVSPPAISKSRDRGARFLQENDIRPADVIPDLDPVDDKLVS